MSDTCTTHIEYKLHVLNMYCICIIKKYDMYLNTY